MSRRDQVTKYLYIYIASVPSPGPKSGWGAHSPAAKGVGESQFRRLEKRLSHSAYSVDQVVAPPLIQRLKSLTPIPESRWGIIEDQAFSPSYDLAPSPPLTPPVNKIDWRLKGRQRKRDNLLTGEWGGGNQKYYDGEKGWSSTLYI
jgi:hypothetical protein